MYANDDDEGEDSNKGEGSKGLLSAKEGIEGKEMRSGDEGGKEAEGEGGEELEE